MDHMETPKQGRSKTGARREFARVKYAAKKEVQRWVLIVCDVISPGIGTFILNPEPLHAAPLPEEEEEYRGLQWQGCITTQE